MFGETISAIQMSQCFIDPLFSVLILNLKNSNVLGFVQLSLSVPCCCMPLIWHQVAVMDLVLSRGSVVMILTLWKIF